jgi:glutamyl/glutaminyl-tRNA synthetase
VIEDAIRGRVERTEEKDFVIVRSDGNPVFHLVNVVDDIAMQVTHVIRGEDHLSNTSKHTELFKAFGAPLPVYAHIPLILKQNGPGKMSKRDQGALIEDYQKRGFLPEALVNFLCLLGWSPRRTGRSCRSTRSSASSTCRGSTRATRASTRRSSRT